MARKEKNYKERVVLKSITIPYKIDLAYRDEQERRQFSKLITKLLAEKKGIDIE